MLNMTVSVRAGFPCAKQIFRRPLRLLQNRECLSLTLSTDCMVVPKTTPESKLLLTNAHSETQLENRFTISLKPKEEVLHKYLKPKRDYVPLFNLAAYVNKNSTLQEFVKLGVNLHKIEITKGAPELILRLDFERDVKKYLLFLHDIGVSANYMGSFITKNPFIFNEDLDYLQIRINYLESKSFTPDNISRIITKNPRWLSYKTQNIDDKLGYFQNKFKLSGPEVRHVAVRMPAIVTFHLQHIEETYFSVKEEMGFLQTEVKELILKKPKVFTLERSDLLGRCDYLLNIMGIKHSQLTAQPGTILCRQNKLKERHLFLKSLGRDQFDPNKPGYVAPLSLVAGTDAQFCTNVAKISIATYNRFLKTLC